MTAFLSRIKLFIFVLLDKLRSYLLQQVSKISNFITLTQEMSKQQHTNSSDLGCSKNMQLASAKNSEKSWQRLERDVKDLLLSCIGKCPINTCCSLFCVSAVFVCLKKKKKKSFLYKILYKSFLQKTRIYSWFYTKGPKHTRFKYLQHVWAQLLIYF